MGGHRWWGGAALAVAALVAAACGTRLPDEAFVQSGGGGPAGSGGGSGGQVVAGGTTVPGGSTSPGATTPGESSGGATATTTGGASTGGDGGTAGGGPGTPAAAGPNQASDTGVTETTIAIGTIVAENGVLGQAFAPAARGLRAWAEAVNAAGGINGRTVVLHTCDDREDRARALECARRLVEENGVFALVATNTRAFGGAAQYLHDQGVPVLGFPITNSFYRYPRMWSLYSTWYPRDGNTAGFNGNLQSQTGSYRWFREQLGATKAAVVTYDIAESAQAGDFVVQGLELEGYTVQRFEVSFAAPAFDQVVADMQRQGTQVIFDTMDDGANRRLCDAMARRSFTVLAKVSTVVAFGDSTGTAYPDACRESIHITGWTVPFTETSNPTVAQFRDEFARYQPGQPLHQWAFEAWLMGGLVRRYLEQAGPAPTRDGFAQFLDGFAGDSLGGVHVGFTYQPIDYTQARLPQCIVIARWDDDAPEGWVRVTEPFPLCYADAQNYATPVREQGN